MLKKPIPYSRQWITSKDIDAVVKALRSDFLTTGPQIEKFEKAVASYAGVKYAVAFSSGTAALHGACFAADVREGDEVITTPMTFAATANCVVYCGGLPLFVDTRNDLPLIDPEEIKKKITPRTKAIIPVDYSGVPCDYDEINALAKKHNLIVIADAAHSLGASYKGKKVGQLADMSVFSFHPVKLITTGEGGMVVTDQPDFYKRLKLFRTHGITKDMKFLKQKDVGPWYYEMQELGFNYRLTDIQAALGYSQCKRMGSFIHRRQMMARRYQKVFRTLDSFQYLSIPPDRTSAWHIFPIQLQGTLIAKRKQIVKALHKKGIMVQIHYIPVHLHPFYRARFKYKEGDFPHAEAYYEAEISLPLFPKLTISDMKQVEEALTQALS